MGGQDNQEQRELEYQRRIRELEALVAGLSSELNRVSNWNDQLVKENDKLHLIHKPFKKKRKHGRR